MYLKIKTVLLAVSLIAALVIVSNTESLAMAKKPSYTPGNQGGYQNGNNSGYNGGGYNGGYNGGGNGGNNGGGYNGGGGTHHSAPEPSTLILIGTGFVGLWALRKKLK